VCSSDLLATQISSINEIANFATKIGNININEVVKAIKLDKRWNPIINKSRVNPDILKYLEPGCGFGGSCFTKDLQALISQGNHAGLPMKIMDAVLEVNKNQPFQVCKILESAFGKLSGRHVLLLGLAFKPETDDVRESPALKIATNLIDKGAKIFAHDPVATANFKNIIGIKSSKIKFVNKWSNYLKKVEIIIIVTPWREYYSLINLKIDNKVIFDTRSFFSKKNFPKSKYLTIG
jgi:UDPglucose 6-dehydrogenase/GDP-mannose 6-dehydrogenase